jgi:hypothetical protein
MQKEWGVTENFEAKVHITLGYQKTASPNQESEISQSYRDSG